MTYEEQKYNPKGVLVWGSRFLDLVEWTHHRLDEGCIGTIKIRIPYKVHIATEAQELCDRIKNASIVKMREWDHNENGDMLMECRMDAEIDTYDCVVTITTRNTDIHNYFKRIRDEEGGKWK